VEELVQTKKTGAVARIWRDWNNDAKTSTAAYYVLGLRMVIAQALAKIMSLDGVNDVAESYI
jgi:hypothetical protein